MGCRLVGRRQWAFHGPPKQKVAKIPKCSELRLRPCDLDHPVRPPLQVLEKVASPELIVGIDIETHDWIEMGSVRKKGRYGQFGFYTLATLEDISFARIVQISWAIGAIDVDTPTTVKVYTIRPDGFCIADKCAQVHRISNDSAIAQGAPLAEALRAFMNDVTTAYAKGARLVAHHLEFDGGIIKHELGRVGLDEYIDPWQTMVQQGFCTMDPAVGKWVLMCLGRDSQSQEENGLCGWGT